MEKKPRIVYKCRMRLPFIFALILAISFLSSCKNKKPKAEAPKYEARACTSSDLSGGFRLKRVDQYGSKLKSSPPQFEELIFYFDQGESFNFLASADVPTRGDYKALKQMRSDFRFQLVEGGSQLKIENKTKPEAGFEANCQILTKDYGAEEQSNKTVKVFRGDIVLSYLCESSDEVCLKQFFRRLDQNKLRKSVGDHSLKDH